MRGKDSYHAKVCYQLNLIGYATIILKSQMAMKLGLLMLSAVGLVNAGNIHIDDDNGASIGAFGWDDPIVNFRSGHTVEYHDNTKELGKPEEELSLGYGSTKVVVPSGKLYYYWNPLTHCYYTRSVYGWKRVPDFKCHSDCDHSHVRVVSVHGGKYHVEDHDHVEMSDSHSYHHKDHHEDRHEGHHAEIKKVVETVKVPVVETTEVKKKMSIKHPYFSYEPVVVKTLEKELVIREWAVKPGPKGHPTRVPVLHRYVACDMTPVEFEALEDRAVVVTANEVRSPINIVSVPNVATVHFE